MSIPPHTPVMSFVFLLLSIFGRRLVRAVQRAEGPLQVSTSELCALTRATFPLLALAALGYAQRLVTTRRPQGAAPPPALHPCHGTCQALPPATITHTADSQRDFYWVVWWGAGGEGRAMWSPSSCQVLWATSEGSGEGRFEFLLHFAEGLGKPVPAGERRRKGVTGSRPPPARMLKCHPHLSPDPDGL